MKPLLNLKHPESVYFCEKPLPQAKPEEIRKVSTTEINTLFAKHRKIPKFSWSDDFLVPDDCVLTDRDRKYLAELTCKQIPSDSFVICFINDTVGYGIFAREEIAENSIVFYGGKVTLETDTNVHYCFQNEDGTMLDASETSGHAAIFQDLYSAETPLSDMWNFVARNNFESERFKLSCTEVTYFRATKTIKAGEQCGHSYKYLYWNILHIDSNIVKQYFDLKGNCITETYNTDFLAINELTVEQITAIRKDMPLSKSKDLFSLINYSAISKTAREVVRASTLTPEYMQAVERLESRPIPTFFNRINRGFILKKYKLSSPKQADVAFRKASAVGNIIDMQTIFDLFCIDINAKSSNNMTALHWAYEGNQTKAIAWLLDKNVNVNIVDDLDRTPAMCATQKRPAKVVTTHFSMQSKQPVARN